MPVPVERTNDDVAVLADIVAIRLPRQAAGVVIELRPGRLVQDIELHPTRAGLRGGRLECIGMWERHAGGGRASDDGQLAGSCRKDS